MSKYLTREQILGAPSREYAEVKVPEWGGTVRLRSMTGTERDAFENSLTIQKGGKDKRNTANFRARFVALCIVDEHDNLVFNAGDILKLGEKSAGALQRVFNKASEMNNVSEEDVDDLTADFEVEPVAHSTSD